MRKVIKDDVILDAFDGPPEDWAVSAYRVNWDPDDDDNQTQTLEEIEEALLDETTTFTTSMTYDALNRIKQMIYPEDVDTERKVLVPEYNKAGALTGVKMKDTEASETEVTYVDRIAYNARGQRILVAFGNGVMTRYRYDDNNFRLTRMKTEKYTKDGLTYTPNGGVRQNLAYTYDLSGNIIEINNQTDDCGIAGADELTREFSYDPLYRLLSATGREKDTLMPEPWYDTYMPDNPTLTRGYTQNYTYDKLGNILTLQHVASDSFTRIFNPDGSGDPVTDYGANNLLHKIKVGSSEYEFDYDENGNIISDDDSGSRFYEYDYADRIRTFRVQAGTSEPSQYAHYLYDGGGNRVKKIVRKQGGGYKTTVYIDGLFEYHQASSYADAVPNLEVGSWTVGADNDGEYNILHIMDDQSRIATRRIGDDNGDISGDTTPPIKYNIEDHLGSSSIHLDTNGTLVNFEEYYPFGETSFGSYGKKRYRFCGKEKDEESGLYYYGMRYYSAWTCRFMSVDPLAGKYPFYTPYQYAGNKPIISVDIDGLEGSNDNGQQTHTVQKGDTLEGLSKKYNTTVDNLVALNPQTQQRKQANQINIGENIIISKGANVKASSNSAITGAQVQTRNAEPTQALVGPIGDLRNVKPITTPKTPPPIHEPIPPPRPWWVYPVGAILLTVVLICKTTDAGEGSDLEDPQWDPYRKPDKPTPPPPEDSDEEDNYVYRAMEMDADGKPNVPPSLDTPYKEIFSRHLAVRDRDLQPNKHGLTLRNGDGTVSPGHNKGGMSTSLIPSFSDPEIMKKINSGKLVIFKIKTSDLLKNGLIVDPDGGNHAAVQPAAKMTERQYQANIRKTRKDWTVWKP